MAVSVILPLMKKLEILLINEANYLLQVKPEMELLQKQLKLMIASLKDVDAMHDKSDLAKEWVKQLIELAFEAEDAIDFFVYEEEKKQFPKLPSKAHKLRGILKDIQGKIHKLSDDKMKYGIKPLYQEDQASTTQARHKFRPVDVVGLQREETDVAKLLMKEEPVGRFGVVSVTGMGGVGKTTLAQKVYDRDDVKRYFVCQAYVCISKEYRMKDVLYNITKQVMVLTEKEKEKLKEKNAEILKERLSDFLKEQKNYLFLFDDVWSTEDWDKLKLNFPVPSNHQQCRVLLTTRYEGVARHADPISPPYQLRLLDEGKSLQLFSKVVFRSPNDTDANSRLAHLNKEMRDLAINFVRKCDGLPLAIVVLGGLLSEKRRTTIDEWRKVLDSVNWHLGSTNFQMVLGKSYTELPYHLKPCFLYFGCFPEGTEIGRDRLIRLWVAEGFLEPRGSLRIEDVGGECLEGLVQRNMIQVASWKSNGVPQSFIMHDLLLSLARSETKKINFLNISTPHKSLDCYRRVALCDKCSEDDMAKDYYRSFSSSSNSICSFLCCTEMSSLSSSNRLRSLLWFSTEMFLSVYGRFKLLNVLDLEDAPDIERLPKEIGNLIFLKYLSLQGTSLKTLPPWVGNLYNLETLNVGSAKIAEYHLPIEILKLDKLRHLLCFRRIPKWKSDDSIFKSCQCLSPPRHLKDLSHLQTLWLETGDWIEDGLEMLTDLRDLRIVGSKGLMVKFIEVLLRALLNLLLLEVLFLVELGSGEITFPSLARHVYLHDLYIAGCIRKLPSLKNFPPNLTMLRLANTHLNEDMILTLEKLPQLKKLTLDKQPYDGESMKCSARGFPKLEDLTLHEFHLLSNWIVEEGAMSNLRILEIDELYGLKYIPDGLRHNKKLKKLTLAMPKEFLERVKEGGEDWEKIKHIPSINIRDKEIPEEISKKLLERNAPEWFHIYRGDD